MTESTKYEFPVDRDQLQVVLYWTHFWQWLLLSVLTLGVLAPGWILWIIGGGRSYTRRFAASYSAFLENGRIRVNEGVYAKKRKAIPLDRITDVVLYEGILHRRRALCDIHIQTAGQGAARPEAVLYAIPIAEGPILQERILQMRDAYVKNVTDRNGS